MKDSVQIGHIFKPEHEHILENEMLYSFQEVLSAKKQAKIEIEEARRNGITVDELRFKKQIARQELSKKIKNREDEVKKLQYVDLQTFGNTCFHFLIDSCEKNGSKFRTDLEKEMNMYREIIRYFYWSGDCKVLDKKRYLYLFGVYGCGKSILVKSIYKALYYHRRNDWSYFHLPTITKNYMSNSKDKNDAFETLFLCSKNMIIDEIGDKSEKQKFYGNEIESVRSLILDKYDKWISNNQNPNSQKIVFTSNLFPDKEYFFTASNEDNRPTLRNFYDDKVYNKMGEMCNLVRFPNVSYRIKNKVELL
jgi:DNA replication protein DnaC